MGRPRRMPAKQSILSAASLCVVAVLPGCSAVSSSTDPPVPTTAPSTVHSAVHSAVPSAGAALAFTVAGVRPVLPSGSQDTHAQTLAASCDNATFAADKALGDRVVHGFALAGFPAAADLLAHFLAGKGTRVNYRAGSPVSKKALASGAFRAVNNEVAEAILSQLEAGRAHVRLSAAQLPTVAFESGRRTPRRASWPRSASWAGRTPGRWMRSSPPISWPARWGSPAPAPTPC
jgi:hypothetical protein